MSSSLATGGGPSFNQPTNTKILASGPSPTPSIDCNNFAGVPLLPASDNYVCGTRTNNRTLVENCCNGARVTEYMSCFQHCEMSDFTPSDMRDFVACLSKDGNSTSRVDQDSVDPNVFCQGQLNSTVDKPSIGAVARSSTKSTGFLFCVALIALLLVETVTSECTATIEGPALIRQGLARHIGAGVRCSDGSSYCIVDQTGTDVFVAINRNLDGEDAADDSYDEFFSALGDATDPPRLFATSISVQVRQWAVGVASDDRVNDSFWAPFMVSLSSLSLYMTQSWSLLTSSDLQYCVNATASDCGANVADGTKEACGAWYQNGGTGLEEDPVVSGVFLRTVSSLSNL